MTPEHAAHAEIVTRWAMALAMVVVGVAALAMPRCFAGVAGYFTRWAGQVPVGERERLDRVIAAREEVEGLSSAYGRGLGVVAILLAALEVFRSIPYVLPYALFCLAAAAIMLLAYLQFHRATQRRVAPLVRRSPFTALPPFVIAAMACSFGLSLGLATYPPVRYDALIVAASALLLAFIAWRVAVAPAILVGTDPQWEYAVDERVRIGRARSIANLTCAPTFALIVLTQPTLPQTYAVFGTVAVTLGSVAFVVSLAASLIPLRRQIRPA
ncbi:MAG TPA: hypothetical protein VFE16_13220 [Candidatus Cybelea sp.]|jgi:hypothetical protein|nr:hypothetical protein [Candidatus Cybelea sp.]